MNADSEMTGTVAIRLVGGLGNQMFQYAAALGLAERQSKALRLDLSAFDAYQIRSYQLDRLRVPQDLCAGVPMAKPVFGAFAARVVRRLKRGYFLRDVIYQEPHFHFDKAFCSLNGEKLYLEGYFQSPRYFEGVEKLLRERFQAKAPLSDVAQGWAAKIAASPCGISLHVRRGDYLTVAASAVHVALDRSYYDQAVSLMLDLAGPEAEFFLFSDDPDFISEAFEDLPNAHVVRSDPSASWEDMFLMARCRHHIIANSSYSWWGAWLNHASGKRVIAPARWFTTEKLATCNVLDLFPNDWILLK